MEKTNEQRAEQRLSYRWPVKFTQDNKEKVFPGQIVDVSSQGMAFLCHADEKCPHLGQQLTTNFAVPHFDRGNSFDTVLFKRTGYVHRLDALSSRIHRVVVQFTEPLFFKPGEQEISESDLQNRLEAKALSILKTEEKVKVYDEALTRAEEQIRFHTETNVKAQAFAKSETQTRVKAEARAKSEAKLRAKAEKQAKIEAERRAMIEAQAQKKDKLHAEEIARIKDEKARAIAQAKTEMAETIAKIEGKLRSMGIDKIKITEKHPIKDVVLEKVDKFVKDRSKIF
jgi:hypothetical protein